MDAESLLKRTTAWGVDRRGGDRRDTRSMLGSGCLVAAALLVLPGCRSFIVNGQSANPTESGTRSAPFHTIARAISEARGSDTIVVVGNQVYPESITLKRGQTLRADAGTAPTIAGQNIGTTPAITSLGRNRIEGFRIIAGGPCDGLGIGIRLTIDAEELARTQSDHYIRNNEFRCFNSAIQIQANNAALAADHRSLQVVHIHHNLTDVLSGNAVVVTVQGPSSGAVHVSMDFSDNLIRTRSAGLRLQASGVGDTPGGNVRTQISGFIKNNLMIEASNGIQLEASARASVSPFINNNTIDLRNNSGSDAFDGITAESAEGNAGGSVSPTVQRNVIVGGRLGYQELGPRSSAAVLRDNIFFGQISAPYFDVQTDSFRTTENQLNTPIVNNQVVFFEGTGNRVTNPQFVADPSGLPFFGAGAAGTNPLDYVNFAAHFLQQGAAATSPAVNSSSQSAVDAGVGDRSTRTDRTADSGVADRGFHYLLVEGPVPEPNP